jgi:monovalent cation:H+ antiporter-2, CPA2 family
VHNLDLILTLAAGLAVALVFGLLAHRAKLPTILGYLVAGLLIGPHTPGFVANRQMAQQLAEIGVILLMFGVGMHFHVKDFLAVRGIAITGALFQGTTATALGALAAHSLGWSWSAGIVFGLTLSVASTVVFMRVFSDQPNPHRQSGRIAVGWLVCEDIFTVFVLVILPVVFGTTGGGPARLPLALGLSAVKLAALAWLALGPGARLIPRLLTMVARTGSREIFTLTVLTIALGVAVGSSMLFGVSMALGAFLAGMVVGQSEFSFRAASEALPMRDAFAVLFFVSVGMLFDPLRLIHDPVLSASAVGIVMLGNPLAAAAIVMLFGYGLRIGLRVAVALAHVGEFSFMLAVLGNQLSVLPDGATNVVVGTAILSITLNPLLYRLLPSIEQRIAQSGARRLLEPRAGRALSLAAGEGSMEADARPRAIVVGYGPVGETVTRLLSDQEMVPTVIELNIDTVHRLKQQGIPAVYGDATQADVLREAGAASAVALILTTPGTEESPEIIKAARILNPHVQVLARAAFVSQAEAWNVAGADQVFSAEAEVALAMMDAILERAGATPEQMDMERERTRAALYGPGEGSGG